MLTSNQLGAPDEAVTEQERDAREGAAREGDSALVSLRPPPVAVRRRLGRAPGLAGLAGGGWPRVAERLCSVLVCERGKCVRMRQTNRQTEKKREREREREREMDKKS